MIFPVPVRGQVWRPPPSAFPLAPDWVAVLDGPPAHAATTDGDSVYVALLNGRLFAVSTTDGRIRWSVDEPTAIPPTVGDGVVFVATSHELRALDSATGIARWRLVFSADVSAPVLWDTGWLIVGLESGDVLAYRAIDGEPLWRQHLGGIIRTSPSIADERVYVPLEDGRIVALDLLTGAWIWERQLGGAPAPILALDDRLFVGTTDNFFYCVSLRDGSVIWRWRTGADIIGAAVVDRERVYFVSLDNQIRALDRRTGVQRWRRELPTRPAGGPRQHDYLLLLTGRAPLLQLYYAGDGQPAGQLTTPAELAGPPLVFPDGVGEDLRVLFLTGEGELHAYRTAGGLELATLSYLPAPWDFDPTEVALVALANLPGLLPAAERLVDLDYLPGLGTLDLPLAPVDDLPGRRSVPPLVTGLRYVPGLSEFRLLVPLDGTPGLQLTLPIIGSPEAEIETPPDTLPQR